MDIKKRHEGVEGIADRASGAVLDIVRSHVSLPPFLELVGGKPEYVSGSAFIEGDNRAKCVSMPAPSNVHRR